MKSHTTQHTVFLIVSQKIISAFWIATLLLLELPHCTAEVVIFQERRVKPLLCVVFLHIQSYQCRQSSLHPVFSCSGVNLAPLKYTQLWIDIRVSRIWPRCIFLFIKNLKHFESPQVRSTKRNLKYINSYRCAHFHA